MFVKLFMLKSLLILASLAPFVLEARMVEKDTGDCKYKGGRICHGAVVKETKLGVKICLKKILKFKTFKSGIRKGSYPLVGVDTGPGKDCVWYGQTYCDGDSVIDLNRWTFVSRCGGCLLYTSDAADE